MVKPQSDVQRNKRREPTKTRTPLLSNRGCRIPLAQRQTSTQGSSLASEPELEPGLVFLRVPSRRTYCDATRAVRLRDSLRASDMLATWDTHHSVLANAHKIPHVALGPSRCSWCFLVFFIRQAAVAASGVRACVVPRPACQSGDAAI
jgi:hypothetical protein